MSLGPREAAASLRTVGEELEELHRGQHQPEAPAEIEVASIAYLRTCREGGIAGPAVQLRDQDRV
jgi:hypothetical protein